jgi:hypothetical protein
MAGPSIHGVTVAARAFTLVLGWPGDDALRPAGSGPLPVALRQVGELDAEGVNLVLVFPLLKARPRCVREVELWLRLVRYQPQFHVAAYPSKLVSLASDRPAAEVGFETLIDNRPRGDATVTADEAWMHFDVTGPVPHLGRRRPLPLPAAHHQAGDAAGGGRAAGQLRRAVLRGPLRPAQPGGRHRPAPALDGGPELPSLQEAASTPGTTATSDWGRRRRTGPLVRCRRGGGTA